VAPDGRVTGVDPSRPAVSYATRRSPGNCAFTVGVAQHLGWPDHSFDVVTSTLAVHHIPEAARAGAFAEMYRVTRPGGRLLVADFRPSGGHRGPHARRHGDTEPATPLDSLAEAAGYRVEATGDLPLLRYVSAARP
jgi:ubiquinone/menaquinone biosynthesis C-methylase UbiE